MVQSMPNSWKLVSMMMMLSISMIMVNNYFNLIMKKKIELKKTINIW